MLGRQPNAVVGNDLPGYLPARWGGLRSYSGRWLTVSPSSLDEWCSRENSPRAGTSPSSTMTCGAQFISSGRSADTDADQRTRPRRDRVAGAEQACDHAYTRRAPGTLYSVCAVSWLHLARRHAPRRLCQRHFPERRRLSPGRSLRSRRRHRFRSSSSLSDFGYWRH
jgi:hypothetical protein